LTHVSSLVSQSHAEEAEAELEKAAAVEEELLEQVKVKRERGWVPMGSDIEIEEAQCRPQRERVRSTSGSGGA
jgi:hypothetical protein